MKRLLGLISCLFVLFAGAASTWASCKQVSIASDEHQASSIPGHTHDHHPGSNHDHSQHSAMHCLIQQFVVPTASFAVRPDREVKRGPGLFNEAFASHFDEYKFHRLSHHPPVLFGSASIAFHLFLSVLRI
jgi:hypothetical protein